MIILRDKSFSEDSNEEKKIKVNKGKPSRQAKRKGHVPKTDHVPSKYGNDPNNPVDIANAIKNKDEAFLNDVDNKFKTKLNKGNKPKKFNSYINKRNALLLTSAVGTGILIKKLHDEKKKKKEDDQKLLRQQDGTGQTNNSEKI